MDYGREQSGTNEAASLKSDLTTLTKLLQAQTDPSERDIETGDSQLHILVASGQSEVLKAIINASADVDVLNRRGRTAIHLATKCGDLDCLSILLNAQADIDLDGTSASEKFESSQTALYQASNQGQLESVKLLVSASSPGRVLCSDGLSSPLHAAAQHGHSAVVSALIDGPARLDVNLRNEDGATPLFIASKFGYDSVIQILIRAQADVDMTSSSGCTPLYMACQNEHANSVDELLAAQANANVRNVVGAGPLHIASQKGFARIVDSLLRKGNADPNLPGQNEATAINLAAHMGHKRIVARLIAAKADVKLMDDSNISPLTSATMYGHPDIVKLLMHHGATINLASERDLSVIHVLHIGGATDLAAALVQKALKSCDSSTLASLPIKLSLNVLNFSNVKLRELRDSAPKNSENVTDVLPCETPRDVQLSLDLHSALNRAGFTRTRATLQSSVADVLQEISRRRCRDDGLCVVGSFSEGWGNSVSRLNGRTDVESDIDVTQLLEGRLFHMRGMCKCPGVDHEEMVDYQNGHISCTGFASTPARPEEGSALKPAIDRVDACRICCYPPIGPLSAQRRSTSNLPETLVEALEIEIASNPCHVVHAAPPGQAGKQLRVSTTFLEKRMLRSLSSLQGQLFVTLKYLVKKVISVKVKGIKAYHAKTVTFRMVEETPDHLWKPEYLLQHISRALQILLASVKSISSKPDGRVMDHFFLSDAALYLKGDDRSTAKQIEGVLQETIENLSSLLQKFLEQLQALESTGRFYFHPFLITPVLDPHPVSQSDSLEYHEIYDVVRDALIRLSDTGCNQQESLSKSIGRMPDCARTARECLRAMVSLKIGDREAAAKIVADCPCEAVSRGIDWLEQGSGESPNTEMVFRYLTEGDTAWRFCFCIDRRPELTFLPGRLPEFFPGILENYRNYLYVNFDSLLKCLRFELLPASCEALAQASTWFDGAAQRCDSDTQDQHMALLYCSDYDWRKQLIFKFNILGSLDKPIRTTANYILEEDKTRSKRRMAAKLAEFLEEMQHRLTEEQIAFFRDQLDQLQH